MFPGADERTVEIMDKFPRTVGKMRLHGNWMRVAADTKKGSIEKLIPVSSVLSIEIVKEGN